jgi:hypothetical protein
VKKEVNEGRGGMNDGASKKQESLRKEGRKKGRQAGMLKESE